MSNITVRQQPTYIVLSLFFWAFVALKVGFGYAWSWWWLLMPAVPVLARIFSHFNF